MLKKLVQLVVIAGGLMSLSACSASDTKSWQEEVKLLDGRVIVVNQQRRYEGGV